MEELILDCSLGRAIAYLPKKMTFQIIKRNHNLCWKRLNSKALSQKFKMQFIYLKDNHSPILRHYVKYIRDHPINQIID